MAHHIIQWRHVGLAALIVVAAHLVLALLFMMSRREDTTVESPVITEIGFVPPVLIRKGPRPEKSVRRTRSASHRQETFNDAPSEVAPLTAVRGEPPPEPADAVSRETLGATLRHAQACRRALMEGSVLPPDCPARGEGISRPLPVKPGDQPYWDKQINDNAFRRRYKSEPGNTEYWQRVNRSRSDPQRHTPQE
ncbi:hypothetical protein [Asticcacaulis excentricus]|uniref:hypothetical protein n=1 Tax=Asticcacaulis excentricus TaxID=78587 RepID=UPI000F84DA0C|nr:hypothetical protein [Asticcacaulis excentricus]